MARPRKPKPQAAPTTQPTPASPPAPAPMPAATGFIRGTAHAQRAGRKGGSTRKTKPTTG